MFESMGFKLVDYYSDESQSVNLKRYCILAALLNVLISF